MGRTPGLSSARSAHAPKQLFSALSRVWWLPVVCTCLALVASIIAPASVVLAAPGTVTGLVYADYNANGTQDQAGELGVATVTVSAYDASSNTVPIATTTTAANGTYTLTVPATGVPLRIEFTNLPSGYQTGPAGTGSGTTEQFITAAPATNVNLGILKPNEYCQNNPDLVTQCYLFGAQNKGTATVRVYPYQSGTTSRTSNTNVEIPLTPTLSVNDTAVGATWGTAYARTSKQIYVAALMKRHVGYGPSGPGAIYKTDRATGTTTLFVNLNAVFSGNPAGTDTHTPTNTAANAAEAAYFDDNGAWDGVGKAAFGDIDMSQDEASVWAINMGDRKLYKIPTSGALTTATISVYTLPNPGTGATGCPNDAATPAGELNRNLRPGALGVRNGRVYVGMVCTAQSTQTVAQLRAFVYAFDPVAGTFNTTPVVNIPLNYTRGCATTDGTVCGSAAWHPWAASPQPGFPIGTSNTIPLYFSPYAQYYYAQPMLMDIEFDESNAMILGLSDRFGHQSGNTNGAANSGPIEGVSAGDILRFTPDDTTATPTGWTQVTNAAKGEYYYEEGYPIGGTGHAETSLGGLAQRLGSGEIVETAFDPPPVTSNITIGGTSYPPYRSGGLIWLDHTTGQRNRSFQVYHEDEARTFGKAAGLGDVEILCDSAPIEIGNRVWIDTDRDGIQDPGELPLSGVTVRLFNGAGTTQLASTTTSATGNYYFNAGNVTGGILTNTAYQIRIDTTQAALTSYQLTLAGQGSNDAIDSDATQTGNNAIISLTTGSAGSNDHTYDVGFSGLTLGNFVWRDGNNNGIFDAGETPIAGVTLKLWRDNGNGTFSTATDTDTGLTATTDAAGNYLFSGLTAGTYFVQIPTTNFASGGALYLFDNSSGQTTGDVNNRDHGVPAGANGIISDPVALTLGGEPTNDGDTDANSNLTIDFGFYPQHSLGNRVWVDTNNDGLDNNSEAGINGVTVNLYFDTNTNGTLDAADTLAGTDTTSTGGYYLFTGLAPGDYFVQLPSTNFTTGGALIGYTSSTGAQGNAVGPYEGAALPDPDTNTDQDDNGNIGTGGLTTTGVTGGISSKPITLGPADDEPTNEAGGATTPGNADATPDIRSNVTLDFGVIQTASLGDFVWYDINHNGQQDAGEPGIVGATVNLYNAAGTTLLATTTTGAGGIYSFTLLQPATNYVIKLDKATDYQTGGPLANYLLTTANTGSDTTDSDATLPTPANPIGTGNYPTIPVATTGAASSNVTTYDVGFWRNFSLGNRVWNDTNNDGLDNNSEAGIDGVTVNLYLDTNASGTLDAGDTSSGSKTTSNGGYYLFTGLLPGNYLVQLPSTNFTTGGALVGYTSSTGAQGNAVGPYEGAALPDPDTNIDQDDNGNIATGGLTTAGVTGGVVSKPITIGPAEDEPTAEAGGTTTPGNPDTTIDARSNLTLDFGVTQTASLGDFVWYDANHNGIQDAGETGIVGATVNLYNAAGTTLLATTTTGAGGIYSFTFLQPNTSYVIKLDKPADYATGGPLVNYQLTLPNVGADDAKDSDATLPTPANPIGTGNYPTIPVATTGAAGTNTTTYDTGFWLPFSLGNRIWNDANNDGLDNNGELGISGVTVNLISGGAVVATATTNAQGYYLFPNLGAGTYSVQLPGTNFSTGGVLVGYTSSTGTNGSATGPYEGGSSPNPDLNVDQDDNGNVGAGGLTGTGVTGGVVSGPIVLGPTAIEPTNEAGGNTTPSIPDTTPDNRSNLTLDFGVFQGISLGNFVWQDRDNDGTADATGEPPIAGVSVVLWRDANGNGTFEPGAGDVQIDIKTTNAAGQYLFSGLSAGNYFVQIPSANFGTGAPLQNFSNSAGQTTGDVNDRDHGVPAGANGVVSDLVTLTLGGEPTDDGDTSPNTNLTIDFGFYPTFSLGNRVWIDTNNDGLDNNGEVGIDAVTVNLFLDANSDGVLNIGDTLAGTDTTSNGGYYLFTGLASGNYLVQLPSTNFSTGGTLVGYTSSTGVPGNPVGPYEGGALDPNGDVDQDDNGTINSGGLTATGVTGGIVSKPITLGPADDEPTNEAGGTTTPGNPDTTLDVRSNLTLDFGVLRIVSLGDFIWNDANHNGIQDGGAETGIGGVTVNLYNGAGTTLIATTTTNASGIYSFTFLQPNTNYVIKLDKPADYATGGPVQNYQLTLPNAGGDDAVDSDATLPTPANPIGTGNYPTIPVATTGAAGTNTTTYDVGFWQPLSLGNRVWNDLNNNGLDDDGATSGIAGVTVRLLDSGGNPVGTDQTTNADGYYLFTGLIPRTYTVELPASNFTGTGKLVGYTSSTGTYGSLTGPFEPGNTTDDDGNDNGTLNAGVIRSNPITLAVGGAPLNEPATPGLTDTATDANSNLTVDFGVFQPFSLGNRVWNDTNNDGLDNNGETGIGGVAVVLLDSGGNQVGATQTTNATGYYLFVNLAAGSYSVQLADSNFKTGGVLVGYTSSTGAQGQAVGPYEGPSSPNPDLNVDQDDNGQIGAAGLTGTGPTSGIVSGQIVLGPGATEPTAEAGGATTPGRTDTAADDRSNLTLDFGVIQTASLGDFIWNDVNHNGVQDGTETGIDGVTVNLYNAAGTTLLATTTTSGGGLYSFTFLQPATNYVIKLDKPADYASGGPLANYLLTTPNAGADDAVDSDATLPTPANPIGTGNYPTISATTGAAGTNVPTFDAGFWRNFSLGNRVWNDANNDGLDNDGAGSGIDGVTVRLYADTDSSGTLNTGDALVASDTTSNGGYYLFTNLVPDNYFVQLPSTNFAGAGNLVGYTSSSGAQGNPVGPYEGVASPDPNNNVDQDDNGNVGSGGLTTAGLTGGISSKLLTLGPAEDEPTAEAGGGTTPGRTDTAPDNRSNLTLDFGVTRVASLGDFIWNDVNHNGVQDGTETGIDGVTVTLYAADGTTKLAETTTSGGGLYSFTFLQPATNYVIKLDKQADYDSGPLKNYLLTLPNAGADDAVDSDATLPTPANPIGAGNYPTIAVATTGAAGTNTTTYDVGFWQSLSLGNRVWNDTNNDGLDNDGAGSGIDGVTVRLLDSGGNPVGTDQPTSNGGYYLFTGLVPGTYTVELPASNFTGTGKLVGYTSSTGSYGSLSGAYEPGNTTTADENDNGTNVPAGGIRSNPVALALGGAPTGEPATPGLADTAADANSDLTIDFGVFQSLSLGNRVWNDTNNDGLDNNGELGVPGVTVNLLDNNGAVFKTQPTDANGYYLFVNLPAGSYTVELPASNFAAGAVLEGFASSSGTPGSATGPFEPANNDNDDADDNGTTVANDVAIRSAAIDLQLGTAPLGEPATPSTTDTASDSNGNLTIDFGVTRVASLGDFIWNDANHNGVQDGTETGIDGVTVTLYAADGTTKLAETLTSNGGLYRFSFLQPVTNYVIKIDKQSDYDPGGSLANYLLTLPNVGGDDAVDSDATLPTPANPIGAGNYPTIAVATTGAAGTSVTTFDAGFWQPLSLGNRIWNDLNNNGLDDDGATSGISGVVVNLLDTNGNVVDTKPTGTDGYYVFTGLSAGDYVVELDASNFAAGKPLEGFVSSTGAPSGATQPYEPGSNDTTDANDNGTLAAGVIRSGTITLAAGTAPTGEPATPGATDPAPDNNSNLTVDFGVFKPYSLGNRVWDDANNDGLDNNGETGIFGVTVQLVNPVGGAVLATTTTNVQGYYLFTDLVPGDYQIVLPAGNFAASAALEGYTSSTGANNAYEPPATPDTTDANDNGAFAGGVISSAVITLDANSPTGEPTVPGLADPAADLNSNLTIDFGVFQPYSLGNRIWIDANNDGLDNGETGLAGITVNLLSGGTVIQTVQTKADGYYLFTNLAAGTYIVQVPGANFSAGGVLVGYTSSTGTNGAPTGPYEGAASPNPDLNVDQDDNGNVGAGGLTGTGVTGGIVSKPITLGPGNAEPANETGGNTTPGFTDNAADDRSNLTLDFGIFQALSLGDVVWQDTNNDGTFDTATETPIVGVSVVLWRDANNNGTFEPGAGDVQVDTKTTGAAGNYLFTGLSDGTYFVQIPPTNFNAGATLEFFSNSTGQTTGDANNKDHGAPSAGNGIVSDPVTLALGTEPTDDGDTSANTNLTIDFGFYPNYSLGNRVWKDTNNDGVDNDGATSGIDGVTVNLFLDTNGDGTLDADDAPAGTATTGNGGYYLFTGLPAGSYIVQLPSTNFATGGVLAGYTSSTGAPGQAVGPFEGAASPNPNGNADQDDNGNIASGGLTTAGVTGGVVGKPITLGPGDVEPTNEAGGANTPGATDTAPDDRSNLTLDFGVTQTVSIGDFIWNDADHDGVQGATETGIDGVTVNLYAANGTTLLASTTTSGGGLYSFSLLQPATNYVIRLDNPADYTGTGPLVGFRPTVPNAGGDDAVDSDATLPTPANPIGTGNYPTITATSGAIGTNTPTFDAGLWQPLSLGNRVWVDANSNGLDDDGATSGIAGVTVQLLDAGGNPTGVPTTTDANGYYLFTNLLPGSYSVELPASNFTGAGKLVGYSSSTGTFGSASGPYEPGSNDNTDGNDNGSLNAGGIRSGTITLAIGAAPTGEPATPGLADLAADNNSNLTVDFGVVRALSLGNRVWNDTNNDGLDNNGELGVGNVTVNLLDAGGAVVATQTTSPQGYYLFVNLPAGSYTVELPASNFTGTGVLVGYASSTGTVASATGPFEPGNTGPNDANDNGSNVGGAIRSNAITLAQGTAPTGEPVTPGLADTATDNNSNATIDFGVIQTVSVGDLIWNDADHNGVLNSGETGISGVTVTLYDSTGTTVVATTVTDANGNYTFNYLQPATNYIIRLDNAANYTGTGPLANFLPTLPNAGSDDALDSDATLPTPANPIGAGNFPTIPVTSGAIGTNTPTFDAGFWQSLSLGNRVWNDINNNGLDDDGTNTGVAGVTVNLLDAGGNQVGASATTNSEGYFLFTGLGAGTYSVQIPASNFAAGGPLDGFGSSTGTNAAAAGVYEPGNTGPADTNDNGTTANGGITSGAITLAQGTAPTGEPATPNLPDTALDGNSNLTIDFGVFKPASLGSLVWNDVNGNGVREPGDNGVPGITVTLYDAVGNVVATTTTDANGNYQFTNLIPGVYTVGFSNLPAGAIFTSPGQGSSNPGGDSTVDPATGRTSPITLVAGQNNPTIWAGITQGPTAVDLVSFTATRENGKVVVRWVTAREVNTVGFNIYRSADRNRENAVKLTPRLVPSTGGSESGATYVFEDSSPIDGGSYWLEELETGGTTRTYGPATTQSASQGQVRILVPIARN